MKSFLLAIILIVITTASTYSQSTGFIKTYGSMLQNNECFAVIQTLDNGLLLAGFGNTAGAGNYDVKLFKTDADGNIQWKSTFIAPQSEYVYDVIQNDDSSYTVAGTSDSGPGSNNKAMLMKVSPTGTLQWTRFYNTHLKDQFHNIVVALDGGYIMAGNSVDFNPPYYGGLTLTHTDTAGNSLWSKSFGDQQPGLNFYIQGLERTLDSGYTVFGAIGSATLAGSFMIHFNNIGDTLWTRYYTTTTFGSTVSGNSFKYTKDGGYLLNLNYSLVRTDSAGNILWAKDYFHGYGDSKVFELENGNFLYAGSHITTNLHYQIYYFEVDTSGNIIWSKQAGESGLNIIQGGTLLNNQRIAFTGRWDLIGLGTAMFIYKDSLDATLRCVADTMTIPVTPIIYSVGSLVMFTTTGDTSYSFPLTHISIGSDSLLCAVTTSINNHLHNETSFEVSPNPASEVLNVSYNLKNTTPIYFNIFNVFGQNKISNLLGFHSEGKHEININLAELSSGFYFIKLTTKDKEVIRKFIKE